MFVASPPCKNADRLTMTRPALVLAAMAAAAAPAGGLQPSTRLPVTACLRCQEPHGKLAGPRALGGRAALRSSSRPDSSEGAQPPSGRRMPGSPGRASDDPGGEVSEALIAAVRWYAAA